MCYKSHKSILIKFFLSYDSIHCLDRLKPKCCMHLYELILSPYKYTYLNFQGSDSELMLKAEEFDLRMKQRMNGENRFLDGTTFLSASTLCKAVRKSYVFSFDMHYFFINYRERQSFRQIY